MFVVFFCPELRPQTAFYGKIFVQESLEATRCACEPTVACGRGQGRKRAEDTSRRTCPTSDLDGKNPGERMGNVSGGNISEVCYYSDFATDESHLSIFIGNANFY